MRSDLETARRDLTTSARSREVDLQRISTDKDSQIAQLQEQLQKLRSEFDASKQKSSEMLKESLLKQTDALKKLQADRDEAHRSKIEAEAQLAKITAELAASSKSREDLQKELEGVRSEISKSGNDSRKQLEQLRAESDQQAKSAAEEIAQLKQSVASEVEKYKEDLKSSQAERANLQAQLDQQIKKSTEEVAAVNNHLHARFSRC